MSDEYDYDIDSIRAERDAALAERDAHLLQVARLEMQLQAKQDALELVIAENTANVAALAEAERAQMERDAVSDTVTLTSFEHERLQSCEQAWAAAFDACTATGMADADGTAMANVVAHIHALRAELDAVTAQRDQLWLEIDPESAVQS